MTMLRIHAVADRSLLGKETIPTGIEASVDREQSRHIPRYEVVHTRPDPLSSLPTPQGWSVRSPGCGEIRTLEPRSEER